MVSIYKRGTESIIKRQNEAKAKELRNIVKDCFIKLGVNDWNELTVEQAMNINISVINKTSKQKKETDNSWVGHWIEADRAKGKKYLFD